MLDLAKEDVALAFGDDLGSFWHPTEAAQAGNRRDRYAEEIDSSGYLGGDTRSW